MVKTQAQIEETENNRILMHETNRNLKLLFWGYIVLVIVFLIMGLVASALMVNDESHVGPAKWYYGIESGILEFAAGFVTLVLAVLISAKNRVCTLLLLGLHIILFVAALAGVLETFPKVNIIPTALGIALGLWGQRQFSALEYLQQQKGYPHFSAHDIDEPAHYDSLYHVRRAQSPDDAMNKVGEADTSRRYQHDRPHSEGVTEASLGIGEMLDGSAPQTQTDAVPMPAANVSLDAMAQDAVSGRTEELPVPQHAVLIEDMSAEGSAQAKQYAPDAEALPTPEDVRARLAAMKQAKQAQQTQQTPPQ